MEKFFRKCAYVFLMASSFSWLSACVSIKIKPLQPKQASINHHYTEIFEVRGQKTPICNVIIREGQLPPGLNLHHKNLESVFEISGKPTQSGDYTYKLEVGSCGTNFAGKTVIFKQTLRVQNQ